MFNYITLYSHWSGIAACSDHCLLSGDISNIIFSFNFQTDRAQYLVNSAAHRGYTVKFPRLD